MIAVMVLTAVSHNTASIYIVIYFITTQTFYLNVFSHAIVQESIMNIFDLLKFFFIPCMKSKLFWMFYLLCDEVLVKCFSEML